MDIEKLSDSEEKLAQQIKRKLNAIEKVSDDTLRSVVFDKLEEVGFKRLSFLSDILEEWDLSHLTRTPAIIAQAALDLNRKNTDEIELYRDLFSQLNREKFIHFIAWCVASGELDEQVVDKAIGEIKKESCKPIASAL